MLVHSPGWTASQSTLRDETSLLDKADGHSLLSDSATKENRFVPHWRPGMSSTFLQRTCYSLHVVLIALHVCLVGIAFHHTEHDVIMPIMSKTNVLTTTLSASLQAFYTLYTTVLVYMTRRVSLARRLSRRQMLTTVHDVTGAWGGLGAALDGLWQQTKIVASPLGVFSVTVYLLSITILHITSSSILQFQNFNNTVTTSVSTAVGWPDSPTDYSAFDWSTIASLTPSAGNLTALGNAGLTNSTVYDVLLDSTGIGNTTVNATSVIANCALVSGVTYESVDLNPLLHYLVAMDGSITTQRPYIPWKDQVLQFNVLSLETTQDIVTFVVTTAIDGSSALIDSTTIHLNWTYANMNLSAQVMNIPSTNLSTAVINTSFVACNISFEQTSAIVDVQSNKLLSVVSRPMSSAWTTVPPSVMNVPDPQAPWAAYLFGSALAMEPNDICTMNNTSSQKCYSANNLDMYLMQLIGMNASQINPLILAFNDPSYSGDTTPSFTLSADQMETALSRLLAASMWTAGQLGEAGGGFDHPTGSALVTQLVLEMRLNINWIPLLFALGASVILLVLAIQMTHIGSEHPHKAHAVNSAGVLELVWLASRSPALRDGVGEVEHPNIDELRAAGMFNVVLADVGGEDTETKTGACHERSQSMTMMGGPQHTSIAKNDPFMNTEDEFVLVFAQQQYPRFAGQHLTKPYAAELTSDFNELHIRKLQSDIARFEALAAQKRRQLDAALRTSSTWTS
ncbi:hypothetical protein BJ138DRAFT_1115739 [Hygrophoropsis aurantiaca]|uniref:Uncharacterized protein n=1 Tax=Hygrophoropsis aurantiaca TaxID=72124 RepID=A0ACB8A692_9AGAM|nr:hypothetical protein BJ138DRAFT_1115739 [Hygrophoropsis aurantiaca]